MRLLLFSAGSMPCALPLESVRIVLQMVELGPPPAERKGTAGTVNIHGQVAGVWSVRSFFNIPDCPPRLTDRLIVTETFTGPAVLWADEAHVIQQSPDPVQPGSALRGRAIAPGVEMMRDGTILFTDLGLFLASGVTIGPESCRGGLL